MQYVRLMWAGNVRDLSKVNKADPVTQSDGELVMLRRAVVLIRALSAALSGSAVNMAAEWEPLARKVLKESGEEGVVSADPGVVAGSGVRVWLRKGGGGEEKVEAVEVVYEGHLQGQQSLQWVDETELFLWPNKKARKPLPSPTTPPVRVH